MKILFLFLISVSLLSACSREPDGFEVKVDIGNMKDGRLLVSERVPPDYSTGWIARIPIRDGKAVYTGRKDHPVSVYLCMISNDDDRKETGCSFLLDNSRITIKGDLGSSDELEVEGGRANDRYMELCQKYDGAVEEAGRISSEGTDVYIENQKFMCGLLDRFTADSCSKGRYPAEVMEKLALQRERMSFLTNAEDSIRHGLFENLMAEPDFATDEALAYYFFQNFGSDMECFKCGLERWTPTVLSNPYIAHGKTRYERSLKVQPGLPAPDFTLADIEGHEYTLSDFRGKYVLLVFSSSGCGWCVRELPFLKKVHETTRGKEFAMFTIDLDWDRKAWEELVRKDSVPWPVISDLKGWKSPATLAYNVGGVPSTYLVDPEGRLERIGLRGGEMLSYINRLFDK